MCGSVAFGDAVVDQGHRGAECVCWACFVGIAVFVGDCRVLVETMWTWCSRSVFVTVLCGVIDSDTADRARVDTSMDAGVDDWWMVWSGEGTGWCGVGLFTEVSLPCVSDSVVLGD